MTPPSIQHINQENQIQTRNNHNISSSSKTSLSSPITNTRQRMSLSNRFLADNGQSQTISSSPLQQTPTQTQTTTLDSYTTTFPGQADSVSASSSPLRRSTGLQLQQQLHTPTTTTISAARPSPFRALGALSSLEHGRLTFNDDGSSSSGSGLYYPAADDKSASTTPSGAAIINTSTLYNSDLSSPGIFRIARRRKNRANIVSSTIDLCNTILGTGIVSLPYAFSTIGLGFGTLFVLVSVYTTWFSLRLLVLSAQQAHGGGGGGGGGRGGRRRYSYSLSVNHGEPSFSSIAQVAMSPNVTVICDAVVALACLGFACSYLVSIGDCMPALVKGLLDKETVNAVWNGVLVNRYFWMVAFLGLIIPISLSRSVDDFWWFSGTALACALYLAVLIIVESLLGSPDPSSAAAVHAGRPAITWFILEWKTFDCIPIFIFAFTCHQNIFSIYKDLDASYLNGDPLDTVTLNHIYAVIDLSVIGVGTVYLIVGWLGFLFFGESTTIIILDNCRFLARVLFALLSIIIIIIIGILVTILCTSPS